MGDREEVLVQFVEQIRHICPEEPVYSIIMMLENCVMTEAFCNCDHNCGCYQELNTPDKPHIIVNKLIKQYNDWAKENKCSHQI